MPLSFGLNASKNPIKATPAKPTPRRAAALLSNDSDSESERPPAQNGTKKPPEAITESITTFDDSNERTHEPKDDTISTSAPNARSKPATDPTGPPSIKPCKQSADHGPSLSSTLAARRLQEDAHQQDPSIYDYDTHYETSSSAALAAQRRAASQKEAQTRTPKYMTHMKSAATQRQRDYLLAEDKRLQREREEDPEGETEAFVTGAYKARQEEARKLDEEEKVKEAEEEKRRKGGMGGFWKGVMDEDEKRRRELEDSGGDGEQNDVREELDKERELAEQAKKLNEQGANIVINEDGLVADKRQLLKGGLNVAARPKGANAVPEAERARAQKDDERPEWDTKEKRDARRAMGERHARMVEQQMEEAKKRKAEEEVAEMQKREMASKSKKTEGEISSAKERYLARKRETEERKKAGVED